MSTNYNPQGKRMVTAQHCSRDPNPAPMPEAPPLPLSASFPASCVLRARRRRRGWRRPRGLLGWGALVAFFFVMNWWMFSRLQDPAARPHFRLRRHHPPRAVAAANSSLSTLKEEVGGTRKGKRPHQVMLTRLLALKAHALAEAETRPEPKDLWKEPINATMWRPCSDQRDWEASEGTNGYIMISANGGINQQRVASPRFQGGTPLPRASIGGGYQLILVLDPGHLALHKNGGFDRG